MLFQGQNMMNTAYIKHLIAEGEGQQLDFKYYISNAAKIAKTLVAFANSKGGRLLIGVKDNGNIIGIESEEEIYMIQLAAESYCKPPVKVELSNWKIDGKTILEVFVPPSSEKPHFAKDESGKWLVYIRKEDENLLADKVLVEVFKRRTSKKANIIRYEMPEKFILEYLTKNGHITFQQFYKQAKIPPYIAERVLVNLVSVGLVKVNVSKEGNYFTLKD
jgi:predicted HTH transcriptional regulator